MSESTVTLLNNPYGQSAFDLFRQDELAFADKSLMIKYLDDKGTSKFPVLLRPRRFGKSTFVRMLKCYYDISFKDRYEELFSGTKIYEENLPSHNSYHVIDFDFSRVNTDNYETLVDSFFSVVILGIDNFKRRYPDFKFDYSKLNKQDSVTLFNYFTNAYLNYFNTQKLYVMIDEYDNFANEILAKNLELFLSITGKSGLLKNFYASIKAQTSDAIAKTFITGVSSVSLDSLTSGFNIALNVTSLDCFNEYAGFTEDELEILIPKLVDVEKLGVTTKEIIERMKPVYDGYCFSSEANKTVYNSSMCLYYLTKVRQKGIFLNPDEYLDPASDHDGSRLSQLFNLTQKETAEFIIDTYLQGGVFYVSKLSENINLNQVREYNLEQLLSMLYYLGYLTIDREKSSPSGLALKIPNRFMSKLFARCTIDFSFKDNTEFKAPKLNLSALTACEDDISSFAESCTEFLSRIMNNQVLSHMNEMALNLALYAKLETMPIVNTYVKMQQSVQVPKEGERFPDLVITVNKGLPDECIYIIELKYLKKTEARDKTGESFLKRAIKDATAELTAYKSAIDFKGRNIKAYAMVFAGPDCVYCHQH
ncbi:Predicted AAA-ATPase [Succinivibrio dextrinosolvens]|uniref:Predicted AAA-ATPase n=1 Tax=Succinivibrio dextrinosolvens TaxID=83771 RepID=A0A662Z7E4_9GAMM|nr:AAA family ATPase [Succinivibrio dextrinosolvens]SFJ87643.1 Predicted AAA-ATPase [Succinivibrio dextrinosolvens]